MKFAWVFNLDAELELARPHVAYAPRTKVLQQLEAYGQGAHALLGPEDVVLEPGGAPPVGDFLGRAWCPTPSALRRLSAAGITPEPHPDAGVLRRVNHRLFAHQAGGGLPDQAYFTERAPLEELLRRGARTWLIKRPLAFAGRGQMRFGSEITGPQWSWLDASLAQDGVIVEPFVTPTLEVSLHGFVWPEGRHELGRICVQVVSDRGVFRGSRLAAPEELTPSEASQLFTQAARVATLLHEARYAGPFGIDGYRYEIDDAEGFCALSEINARYTMAFAIGFPRATAELSLS